MPRAAGVPIVVALNKTDLPGINVRSDLSSSWRSNELLPSEWGGETEVGQAPAPYDGRRHWTSFWRRS